MADSKDRFEKVFNSFIDQCLDENPDATDFEAACAFYEVQEDLEVAFIADAMGRAFDADKARRRGE